MPDTSPIHAIVNMLIMIPGLSLTWICRALKVSQRINIALPDMLINRIDIRIKTGKEYIAIVAIFG